MHPSKTEIYKEAEITDSVREIVIGSLESTIEGGTCQVSFWYKSIHYIRSALVVGALPEVAQQLPVALGFANADLNSPIVLGAIHVNLQSLLHTREQPHPAPEEAAIGPVPDANIIEGAEEVELRCGEASIRLTRSGKVLINGEYVLSCSRGVNRIVGASVEVN